LPFHLNKIRQDFFKYPEENEVFEGEKVRLRSVELTDIDAIMENWNNLKLRRFLHEPRPYSREEEIEWIRGTWQRRKAGTEYQFAVEDKVTKEFLGGGGLFSINQVAHSAELGIAIHAEKNWGKGYGTDTMRVLLEFGFNYLNLNSVRLRVNDFNVRGIKTYKKVGFTEVGKLRQANFVEGKYNDMIFMDILKEEWEKMKEK
jgi:RimJ/RimL family protein N-acetyltransferase